MSSSLAIAVRPTTDLIPEGLWLRSRNWDLTFISLSVVVVAVPFVMYYFVNEAAPVINSVFLALGIKFIWNADASRNLVNGMVALLVGGPHMYATFTRTAFDKNFSRQHKTLLLVSLLIPIGVIYFGVHHFQFLVTFFFFWASIHILHQILYIVECYNKRATWSLSWQSRMIDYAVVFSSLYPIATYKFIYEDFWIGSNKILYPDFLKTEIIFYLVTVIFVLSLVLFVWKTAKEIKAGIPHYPKILLISLTTIVAFFIPAFKNLDVAFQGFNTWHSFQYLGLIYYINRIRHERGEIGTKFIDRMSQEGKTWRYYFFNVGLTVIAVSVIALLIYMTPILGLTFDQCYYVVVLSFLLMHYLHDHLLFTQPEAILLK
ncbi:MAG: hypothetical protein HY707_10735 [Ignavibacteriae bacterium]|nr:hypothetical protein [Ignavibacteriota bacterium]